MRSVSEHRDAILAALPPRAGAEVPLADCLGLITTADVVARVALPGFDNSAMDGYAVRAADVAGASPEGPAALTVVGEVAAGADAASVPVGAGQAVRIMTGAMLPAGADAVVMVEATDGGLDVVQVYAAVPHGRSIRTAGEDVAQGARVIPAGTRVNARTLALAAATGHPTLPVRPRPRVAIVSTGDELIPPGEPLSPGQIHESNSVMLAAACRSRGAEVVATVAAGDEPESFVGLIEDLASECDAIVSSGGVSMGAYDVVKAALREHGIEFVQVAMQPGKPQGFGLFGEHRVPVFALPGNPVSSFVSFEVFVAPALEAMMGGTHERRVVTGVMGHALTSPRGKTQIARAVTTPEGGAWVVNPVVGQGSHFVADLVRANSLVIVPADAESLAAGDEVEVWLLSDPGPIP